MLEYNNNNNNNNYNNNRIEIFILLGCYTAQIDSSNPSVPSPRVKQSWPYLTLEDGPIGCPEAS
jgi:hypothetical protein